MTNKPIIVSIGELYWNVFSDKKQPGGAPASFAFHTQKMGAKSHIISAVGRDSDGRRLMGRLKRAKINQIVSFTDFPTGTADTIQNGDNLNYSISKNVAWDYIEPTNEMESLIKKTDVVYFGTLAQRSPINKKTIQTLLRSTPTKTFKIFDLNLRQNDYDKNTIEESLLQCNVLKANSYELSILKATLSIDEDDILQICDLLISKYNLKYFLYTSGVEYSVAYSSEAYSFIKPPKVKVINTIGAGSAFISCFIMSILKGEKLPKAHERAVHCATHVCTKHSAWAYNQLWNF